jgi:DNA-binding GntR family transcriptional regulator
MTDAYERIAAGLAAKIRCGELKPGDQIPSSLRLRVEYGISHRVARRVREQLRDWGLADIDSSGRGVFVRERGGES